MAEHSIADKAAKYGPGVPPVGFLWSALRAAGEEIELDVLSGISCAALSTLVHKDCKQDVLWQQSSSAAETALPLLGYKLTFLVQDFQRESKKLESSRDEVFKAVKDAIDKGTPVLVEGLYGWGLILGYDDGSPRYLFRHAAPWKAVHDMGKCPPWEQGSEQEERWETEDSFASGWEMGINLSVLQKFGKGLPPRGTVHTAVRRIVERAKQSGTGDIRTGLAALTFWADLLERESKQQEWDTFTYGVAVPAQVIFTTINRAAGARFLAAVAGDGGNLQRSGGRVARPAGNLAQPAALLRGQGLGRERPRRPRAGGRIPPEDTRHREPRHHGARSRPVTVSPHGRTRETASDSSLVIFPGRRRPCRASRPRERG